MKAKQVVRAWKDEEYRLSLSDAERAQLPAHPSGIIELTEPELGVVSGGILTPGCTWGSECFTYNCRTLFCHTAACTLGCPT
jgi:mersacidin/lichenicidin family type 2 lantibiotic